MGEGRTVGGHCWRGGDEADWDEIRKGLFLPLPTTLSFGCRGPRGSRKAKSKEGMEGHHEREAL